MKNYKELANELSGTLATMTKPMSRHHIRDNAASREWHRQRRAQYKAQGLTCLGKPYSAKYGSVNVKNLFAAIAAHYEISEANARVRYYRGQVDEKVLTRARQMVNDTCK